MKETWLDSESDDQAAARSECFWNVMRQDLDAGQFWADRIKQYGDEPGNRLQIAMENLPLPAAFREAAIALRAIIRSKRKAKQAFEDELGLLYWLAAIESFMLPYAKRLKEPGFNVFASIPGKRLRVLPVDYQQVGYEKLSLLKKTDVRWIIEAWGKPQQHQTLNEVHRALWDEYEGKLLQVREAERERAAMEWHELIKAARDEPQPPKAQRSGCFGAAILFASLFPGTWFASSSLLREIFHGS